MREFVVTNPRVLNKNTLIGSFDLTMPSGMIIRGVMLFQSHGKRWVNFPSKEWVKSDGTKAYVVLIEFASKEIAEKFAGHVLPLAEAALELPALQAAE